MSVDYWPGYCEYDCDHWQGWGHKCSLYEDPSYCDEGLEHMEMEDFSEPYDTEYDYENMEY